MKLKWIVLLLFLVLACGLVAGGASPKAQTLAVGGTEVRTGDWIPGKGNIEPGGMIRGWEAEFTDELIGSAGDFASGIGPATMNCNLDENLTGICWGTFVFSNSIGTWEGTWQGSFNFMTGAGSYKAIGHGRGGLKGMTLQNDVVYPGYEISGPTGYVYSVVKSSHGF